MVKERLRAESGQGPLLGWRSLLLWPAGFEDPAAALASGADAIGLDLAGSSGHDAADRDQQLRRFTAAFEEAAEPPALVIQVGAIDTAGIEQDLAAALSLGPEAILLPACTSGLSVAHLAAKLAVWEAHYDLPAGRIRIIASAGARAESILRLTGYAGASARLAALAWDGDALAEALGLSTGAETWEAASPLILARSLLVLGARAAGVPALDTPSARMGETFAQDCALARRDGFSGKITRHLAQVPVINRIFSV